MYTAIREIQREFQEAGLKCGVEQKAGNWVLKAGMSGEKAVYHFLFIKDDDNGNDVAVRIPGFVKFPENKRDKAYEVLNSLQQKYRYVRFNLREDGTVVVGYDFPVSFSPLGVGAVEMLLRITQILDECYPEIMRVIWA